MVNLEGVLFWKFLAKIVRNYKETINSTLNFESEVDQ